MEHLELVYIVSIIIIILLSFYIVCRRIHINKIKRILITNADTSNPTVVKNTCTTAQIKPYSHNNNNEMQIPQQHYYEDDGSQVTKESILGKFAPSVADALISSIPSLVALQRIDFDVFEAIRHSASKSIDMSQWADLKGYLDDHYFDVGQPSGFLNRLVGYVGEIKAQDIFEQMGSDVQMAELSNQPGYDMFVDGNPVNVKIGGIDTIRDHFDQYPDISVATGPEQAAAFDGNEMVIGLSGLEKTGLEETTDTTLDLSDNDFGIGGPTIPTVTTIMSGYRELTLLMKGHTDIRSSLKNAGLDIAGTSLGGWAGLKVGSVIGSSVGPAGFVIGGLIGSISGVIAGRYLANKKKREPLNKAIENYNQVFANAELSIKINEEKFRLGLSQKIKMLQIQQQKAFHKLNAIMNQDINMLNDWTKRKCRKFIEMFIQLTPEIEQGYKNIMEKEMGEINRSPWMKRIVWPSINDIKYKMVINIFKLHRQELYHIRNIAQNDSTEISDTDLIKRIRNLILGDSLHNQSIDIICLKLSKYNGVAIQKYDEVLKTAKIVANRINIHSRLEIQKATYKAYNEIGDLIYRLKNEIDRAKEALLKEARKIGIGDDIIN